MTRITEASVHLVRLPLVHSFQTSSHRKSHLDHILIELSDDEGNTGWGEIASPNDPYYCSETVDTAWLIATEYLIPAVLGKDWRHPGEVRQFFSKIRGNHFAVAGVDAAAWALWAHARGTSLAEALGGTRKEVVAGVSLGIEPTVDDLLAQVQLQVDAGYSRIKLKIAPGWDLDPVKAVRTAFPDADVHVDANGAYQESDEHFTVLRNLDELKLTMIEQPFAPRNLLAHAALQQQIQTPLCLDESVETLDDLRTALALGAGRIVNIKVSRMGGLTPALAAHDLALAASVPVWCGGMHEFGIGRAANIALSSLPGFVLPSDVSASEKYYERDITVPAVKATKGVVQVPTETGLGFAVDTEFIKAKRLRAQHFQNSGSTRS